MHISYFIPEDGDSSEHPNVFSCDSTASTLTLAALRKAFPLPGKYHFRALKTVGGSGGGGMQVWLDLVDETTLVPSHDGDVVLKVSRISLSLSNSNSVRPAVSAAGQSQTQSQTQSQNQSVDQASQQQESDRNPDSSGGDQKRSPNKSVVERRGSEKLISFDTYDDSCTTTPPQTSESPFENSGNFFDFSTQQAPAPVQQPQQQQGQRQPSPLNNSNSMNDFMNFSAPNTTSTGPGNGLQGGGMGMGMGGMNRGSSGNINGMNQMNNNNTGVRQQQQKQQQQNRDAMGGLDPFGGFN